MDVDRRSAGRCGLLRAEHPAKIHGFDLLCDLSDGKSRGERRRLVKPVLVVRKRRSGSSKLSELRTIEGTPKSTRSLPSRPGAAAREPGRRPPVAGARGSWRPEAAPKNTARRVCATCWRMRHAERARKPSSFLKSVHYNKSYASETPMQSIEFTAISSSCNLWHAKMPSPA